MIVVLLRGVTKCALVDLQKEKREALVEKVKSQVELCGAGRRQKVQKREMVGLVGDDGMGTEESKGQYGVMKLATHVIVQKHSQGKIQPCAILAVRR